MSAEKEKLPSKGKQAFLLTLGKLLALAATFLMPVFLTRFLTIQEYGFYVQFNAITAFLIAIFSFGIHNNLYYFFPAVDVGQRRALVFNSLFALCAGAIVVFALLAFPPVREIIIGTKNLEQYWCCIGLFILFSMVAELLEPFYVVIRDTRTSLWFPLLQTIGKLVFVVIFALAWGGVKSIFEAMLYLSVLIAIYALIYCLRRTTAPSPNPIFQFFLLKKQLKYILPFGFSVILFTLAGQFDKILCITFLTTEEYALYAVAFFAIPGIMQIYSSVGNVYLVNMTEAYAAGEKKETLRLFHELTYKIFAFSFPLIAGSCLFADGFITIIFSEKYLAAVPYFQVHVFTFCFTMLGAGLIIRASGKTKYSLLAYLYSAVLTLPATYVGIRFWGMWGGISMSMLSLFCPKFLQMIYEIKILDISIRQYMPWGKFLKITVVSGIVLSPFFFVYTWVTHHLAFAIVGGISYISIVYAVFIFLNLFIIDRKYCQEKFLHLRKMLLKK